MKKWRVTYRTRHENGQNIDYEAEIQAETLQTAFVLAQKNIVEPIVKFPEIYDCILTGICEARDRKHKLIRNPITRTISENLKKLAEEKKVTPTEVADAIGYRKEVIIDYFEGRKQPKVYAVYKMARYFGVSLDRILDGIEEACNG